LNIYFTIRSRLIVAKQQARTHVEEENWNEPHEIIDASNKNYFSHAFNKIRCLQMTRSNYNKLEHNAVHQQLSLVENNAFKTKCLHFQTYSM